MNNDISNNSGAGVDMGKDSHEAVVTNCLIYNNAVSGKNDGIVFQGGMYANITRNRIENNRNNGILVTGESINVSDNVVDDNGGTGIKLMGQSHSNSFVSNSIQRNRIGIYVGDKCLKTSVKNNNISSNTYFGIQSVDIIDATLNWWGHESGPHHDTQNPTGLGDEISDDVLFRPWEDGSNEPAQSDNDDEYERGPIIVTMILSGGLLGMVIIREDIRMYFHSLLIIPLYSKIKKNKILNQSNRSEIIGYLASNPGVHFSSMKRKLPMGNGTLLYHLGILEKEGIIRSKKISGRKLFHIRSSHDMWDDDDFDLPSSPIQTRILLYLGERGPSTMKDIERNCSIKQTSVSYNIRRLMEKGKVTKSGTLLNAIFSISEEY